MSTQLIGRTVAIATVLVLLVVSAETRAEDPPASYGTVGDQTPISSPPPPPSSTVSSPPPPLPPSRVTSPPPRPLTPTSTQNLTSSLPPTPLPSQKATSSQPPQRWNDSYPASDFRVESTIERFVLWPDNLTYVRFVYFCQQDDSPKRHLEDFKYKEGAGTLYTSPYFDLGLVDRDNTPYFRRWRIDWRIDTHRIVCPIRCEYTDLQRLYEYRLHRNVLGTGFGYGLAAIVILQFGVMAFMTLWLIVNRYRVGGTDHSPSLKNILWDGCQHLQFWLDFVPDWIHLMLLMMVGFSMMEAAGHRNFFHWRSMLFYNTGVTYTYLTFSVILSSFLYQCALFVQSQRESPNPLQHAAQTSSSVSNSQVSRITSRTTSKRVQIPDELKNSVRKTWTDDWKYQRIFGQIGVLILMVMYLSSVDDATGDAMNSLASVVAGCITVACIWSFAVSTVIAVRSLRSTFEMQTWKPKPSSE